MICLGMNGIVVDRRFSCIRTDFYSVIILSSSEQDQKQKTQKLPYADNIIFSMHS